MYGISILQVIEENLKTQVWVFIIPFNDSTSGFNQLLNKSSKASMEVKRLRNLALEIF